MEPRLTELNIQEILLYLGYRGQECPQRVTDQILRGKKLIEEAARPRLVYRRLSLENGATPDFLRKGMDIREMLGECREAVIMAVTLGPEIEQLIMRAEVTDMADAVILDSCASTAVENVCDHFEFDLRAEVEKNGMYLSDRFSPGYGDFPIDAQRDLCEVLNAGRRIGLTVTPTMIMIPRKSVTAVMGIADHPLTLRKRGCEVCSMFMTCAFRKKGAACSE